MKTSETTKHKANILEDKIVLMLFIAPKIGMVNEASKVYLELYHQMELKKLRR
jgi:hypothetical protein